MLIVLGFSIFPTKKASDAVPTESLCIAWAIRIYSPSWMLLGSLNVLVVVA